jgi:hypothetical protein
VFQEFTLININKMQRLTGYKLGKFWPFSKLSTGFYPSMNTGNILIRIVKLTLS